jgi:aconitate hydratase
MDARSIAATARNGGVLTSALNMEEGETPVYHFDDAPYRKRVYSGIGRAGPGELVYGPNIGDWPPMEALGENLLVKIVAFITDPVTTTDELIPSGETSSYRSNPTALAEFTLSRKDPAYVGRAKALRDAAALLAAGKPPEAESGPGGAASELAAVLQAVGGAGGPPERAKIQLASAIFAVKPGDGSAREQAASCQRVLGGGANFANEYATKRYRSNLINWGLIPFLVEGRPPFKNGDYVFIPRIRGLISGAESSVRVTVISPDTGETRAFNLAAPELNGMERELLLKGSLINYNRARGAE